MASPAAVPAHAPVRSRPTRRPQRRARPKHRVAGGVFWIVLVAALLAGVVAMNVAVLQLNVASQKLDRQRASLLARNAELRSRLSSDASTGRILALARGRLGLVPANPAKTVYIDLGR